MAIGKKPWSGRFGKPTAGSVEKFSSSIHYDRRLYSLRYRRFYCPRCMLARQKIISGSESVKIVSALKDILKDIEKGKFKFSPADEDIHMAIERELISRIGETGGKLHSARSRNDQIVLDVRLFLRAEIKLSLL